MFSFKDSSDEEEELITENKNQATVIQSQLKQETQECNSGIVKFEESPKSTDNNKGFFKIQEDDQQNST
jgi:hypothetical protein